MPGRPARLLLLLGGLVACSSGTTGPQADAYQYQRPAQVTGDWETASLSDVGLSDGPFTDLMAYLAGDSHSIHGILVVRRGKLVFEEYFEGQRYRGSPPGPGAPRIEFGRDTLHFLASETKSVASTLLGIAIHQGLIDDLDNTVLSYLPQYADILIGSKAALTLRHLLTMSAGLAWDESSFPYGDSRNDVTRLFSQSDPIRFVLSKELISPPGSTFHYNSGATNVLAAVIEKTSGMTLPVFAAEYLFEPLNIRSYTWDRLNSGAVFASGGLHMRPRDVAKIGHLFLQGGQWNGKRIVSQEWVDESQTLHIGTPSMPWSDGYGYQWWIRDYHAAGSTHRAFLAAGWGEQMMIIFPDLDLIVEFTAGYYLSGPRVSHHQLVERYILPAVSD